jgi:hypothetical protein
MEYKESLKLYQELLESNKNDEQSISEPLAHK